MRRITQKSLTVLAAIALTTVALPAFATPPRVRGGPTHTSRVLTQHQRSAFAKLVEQSGWTMKLTKRGEKRGVYELSVMDGKQTLATMQVKARGTSGSLGAEGKPAIQGKGLKAIQAVSLLGKVFGGQKLRIEDIPNGDAVIFETPSTLRSVYLSLQRSSGKLKQHNQYFKGGYVVKFASGKTIVRENGKRWNMQKDGTWERDRSLDISGKVTLRSDPFSSAAAPVRRPHRYPVELGVRPVLR